MLLSLALLTCTLFISVVTAQDAIFDHPELFGRIVNLTSDATPYTWYGPSFVGCISPSQTWDLYHLALSSKGNGVVDLGYQPDLVTCNSLCRDDSAGFLRWQYMYYRPRTHHCFCSTDDYGITANETGSDAWDKTQLCRRGSALAYEVNAAFEFTDCYQELQTPVHTLEFWTDLPHRCLDTCAGTGQSGDDAMIRSISMKLFYDSPDSPDGSQRWYWKCQCYDEVIPVGDPGRCLIGSEMRYTRRRGWDR
ncbi:hypothetical protein IAU60_002885 [Kwoniella sp. DSM 27419]